MNSYKCETDRKELVCAGCIRVILAKYERLMIFMRLTLNHPEHASTLREKIKRVLQEIGEWPEKKDSE